jgi:hypothetical protein
MGIGKEGSGGYILVHFSTNGSLLRSLAEGM